jgi:AmpD protein
MSWNPPAVFQHTPQWYEPGNLRAAVGVIVHSMAENILHERIIYPAQEWLDRQVGLVKGGGKASAHALIKPDGTVIRCAGHEDKCYHAGLSLWKKWLYCNKNFLGVELLVEGNHTWGTYLEAIRDGEPYTDAQYRALAWLIHQWEQECPDLKRENIVGHETVSPGRKSDPGPTFVWDRFRSYLDEAA